MKHVFVFDPKAFYNQQWKMDNILDNIGQFFRKQEKPDFSIQFSRYRRNAIVLIQDEVEKARPGDIVRVYAIGGEEILFDCLNGVAHFPNMELAIVPYGEINNFLKIFQTDKNDDKIEIFKDIPALVNSNTLSTDAIRWGVNYALNSCFIGMNSLVSKRIKDLKSNFNKSSFILFSKITTFINYLLTSFDRQLAARQYQITIDDVDYSGSYSLIHAANIPYHTGKKTGVSDATPNDGLLDIALIKSAMPLTTLSSIRKYSNGKRTKNCVIVQGKTLSVQSKSSMWIQMDNEYIEDTSVNLSIVHNAVQIVAPDGFLYPLASISAAL